MSVGRWNQFVNFDHTVDSLIYQPLGKRLSDNNKISWTYVNYVYVIADSQLLNDSLHPSVLFEFHQSINGI